MPRFLVTSLLILLIAASSFSQTTKRVPQDYATIQAAINAAVNGDTVLVAEGTYFVNLKIFKKIVLASHYLLDGNESHIAGTILDGGSPSNPDSASVIALSSSTDSNTVIIGFTITKGAGTRFYDPTAARYWRGGGGIYISNGAATIRNNIIRNNSFSSSVDGVFGGGIAIDMTAPYWVIENNTVVNNSITTSASTVVGAEGAGMWVNENGRIINNTVDSNSATGNYYGRGGGILIFSSYASGPRSVQVAGNRIRWNYAKYNGGGISLLGATGSQTTVTLTNNLIVKNTAVRNGAGIYVSTNCYVNLINNTLAGNIVGNGGRGIFIYGTQAGHSGVKGINNIFWNPGSYEDEIFGHDFGTFHNNLIGGISTAGENNFSTDPQFTTDGTYRLQSTSPCIGAGTDSRQISDVLLRAPTTDLLGNTRPRTAGSKPDLGAFEEDYTTTTAERPNRVILHSFLYESVARYYSVIKPLGHENDPNLPVIILLQGYDDGNNNLMNYTRLYLNADTARFICVQPYAYQWRWNSDITTGSSYPTPQTDDVGFISRVIDSLKVQYSINPKRVWVVGFGNGGFMAFKLAAKIPYKLAGVVADGSRLPATIVGQYSASFHIPLMIVNGTADPAIGYSTAVSGWLTVDSTINFWRSVNGAVTQSDSKQLNDNSNDGSYITWTLYGNDLPFNENGVKPAIWAYKVVNGGHEWPGAPSYYGSGVINRDISLNNEIFRFFTSPLVRVDRDNQVAVNFELSQNYPNPFNPTTNVEFGVPSACHVNLSVYDLLGREVAMLANEEKPAGNYRISWDATKMASGIYLYTLSAGAFKETKKMLLVR